jgi:hypothetical protein
MAAAKTSDIFHGIQRRGSLFANSDKVLHRFRLLFPRGEVAFTDRFPYQFRDRGFSAPRAGVQCIPQVIVKV